MDSKHSLGYGDGFEYVRVGPDIMRADYSNPLDNHGFRSGLRFWCTRACWGNFHPELSDNEGRVILRAK